MPRDPQGPAARAPQPGLDALARRALRGWLILAIGALAAAGALALLLALARTPGVQDILPWPWESFFHRALVTHVVFAFVLWYLAMLGALAVAARGDGRTGTAGLALASLGAVLMLIPALAGRGQPSLNNYVPVLIDPMFLSGLGLVGLGTAVPVVRLLMRAVKPDAVFAYGVATAGLLYMLALICVGLAFGQLPIDAVAADHAEEIFWGGGHVLQFAHCALLLTAWQVLGAQAFGRPPLPPRAWRVICGLLLISALPGPLFMLLKAGDPAGLRESFTRLYWIGLPVPLVAALLATSWRIWRGPRDWRSPAFLGTALSVALFAFGGILGAFADGTDTRTPAHYHAEIGGVNLAFMGLIFALLLPALGRAGAQSRAVRLQFWLYAGGQAAFSLGMFVAGSQGVARKVAGADQGLDTVVKIAGMALTGAGGTVAVAGGVLFIWLTLRRLLTAVSEA